MERTVTTLAVPTDDKPTNDSEYKSPDVNIHRATTAIEQQQERFSSNTLRLRLNDSVWHKILTSRKQVASKIVHIGLNKYGQVITLLFSFLLYFISRATLRGTLWTLPFSIVVFCGELCCFFTFNVAMIQKIILTFEFWIKLYNLAIMNLGYAYSAGHYENGYIQFQTSIWDFIISITFAAMIAMSDGWPTKPRVKIVNIGLMMLWLGYLTSAMYFKCCAANMQNKKIKLSFTEIYSADWGASAGITCTLFFARQMLKSIIRPQYVHIMASKVTKYWLDINQIDGSDIIYDGSFKEITVNKE